MDRLLNRTAVVPASAAAWGAPSRSRLPGRALRWSRTAKPHASPPRPWRKRCGRWAGRGSALQVDITDDAGVEKLVNAAAVLMLQPLG